MSSPDEQDPQGAPDSEPVAEEAAEQPAAKAKVPAAEKPAAEKPAADAKTRAARKPAAKAEDTDTEPEKPAAKAKAPATNKPATKAKEPVAEKSAAEKPAAKKPASKQPAAKAAVEKAAVEKAAAEDVDAGEQQPRATEPKAKAAPKAPRAKVQAHARYVRTSARKARMVCGHLRGRSVPEARAILAFTPREVARDWSKLLESAVANAENNHELLEDDLIVREAYADEGPTIKRFRPRAMGRATPIRKRTSHLTITLTPRS
jgi:ribosomal protein L22